MTVLAGVSRGEFTVLELGDRLGHGRRRRTEHLHALHGQRAQDDTADAAAKHGVEVHVLLVAGFRLAQRHRVNAARFRVKKREESGLRQMRLDLRIEAFGELDGDAEFHGALSEVGSARILSPAD